MTEKDEAQRVFEQGWSEVQQADLLKAEAWRAVGLQVRAIITGLEQAGFPTSRAERLAIIAVIEIGRGQEDMTEREDQ